MVFVITLSYFFLALESADLFPMTIFCFSIYHLRSYACQPTIIIIYVFNFAMFGTHLKFSPVFVWHLQRQRERERGKDWWSSLSSSKWQREGSSVWLRRMEKKENAWVENSFFIISKWQVTRVNCAKSPATNTSYSMEEWCWRSKSVKSTFFMVPNSLLCEMKFDGFSLENCFSFSGALYFWFFWPLSAEMFSFELECRAELWLARRYFLWVGKGGRGTEKQNSVIIIKKNKINYLQNVYCLNTKWYGNTRWWCA